MTNWSVSCPVAHRMIQFGRSGTTHTPFVEDGHEDIDGTRNESGEKTEFVETKSQINK